MAFIFAVIFGLGLFLCLGLFATAFCALIFPNKVYSWSKDRNRVSLFSGYFLAGFIMFVILGTLANNMPDPKERIAKEENRLEEIRKTIKRVSYKEIRTNIEKLTDLQFEEYTSEIEGRILDDKFYVSDVREKTFGGYSVSLDYDNPKSISLPEIEFGADKSFALKLRKNQQVKCSGIIESVTAVMGVAMVDLDDVRCAK